MRVTELRGSTLGVIPGCGVPLLRFIPELLTYSCSRDNNRLIKAIKLHADHTSFGLGIPVIYDGLLSLTGINQQRGMGVRLGYDQPVDISAAYDDLSKVCQQTNVGYNFFMRAKTPLFDSYWGISEGSEPVDKCVVTAYIPCDLDPPRRKELETLADKVSENTSELDFYESFELHLRFCLHGEVSHFFIDRELPPKVPIVVVEKSWSYLKEEEVIAFFNALKQFEDKRYTAHPLNRTIMSVDATVPLTLPETGEKYGLSAYIIHPNLPTKVPWYHRPLIIPHLI